MNTPNDCTSLLEVRREIDRIDRNIVQLFSERAQYVKAAAKFKTTAADVEAPERVTKMLEERRQWAHADQLSEDFVEALFRNVVEYFIREESREMSSNPSRA